MRRTFGALAALCCTVAAADAQSQRPSAPTGPNTRYYQLSGELMGDLNADAFLKETRQGTRVVSAELDVCHSVSSASDRKDRFVVKLTADGNRLSGNTQSQEDGAPVAVRLTRRIDGDLVDYEGTVTRGGNEERFASADNSAITEDEFSAGQFVEGTLVAEPGDFSEVSPEAILVRMSREAFPSVIQGLRRENVKATLESLVADCSSLRSGQRFVRIDVDPQRAAALVAKLRGTTGVAAAGWTNGVYTLDHAVGLETSAWQGPEGRKKLIDDTVASIARTTLATPANMGADTTTGVTTLRFKRPNANVKGVDLTDTIEVTVTVGPEKPAPGAGLVLWIGSATVTTADEGPEPRLSIISSAGGEGDATGETIDIPTLITALARDLKARVWDSERGVWK